MTATILFSIIISYFAVLLIISFFTGKGANNESFFLGNKKSPWFVVAFGMIGTSLSGVTFISVPGWVQSSQFTYMQMVFGYFFGYLVIANVLMPLYYKLNLTSIYTYLEQRFGFWSYKVGASFFLLSRTFGAAARLYLVALVLQLIVFEEWDIPFWLTVFITILLIWLYTFRSGIKTIIWTDSLQTFFMLLAVGISIYLISEKMQFNFSELFLSISDSDFSQIFVFDNWRAKNFFPKHFLGGAFIAIAMTGLDQDMMQKNLSCKNIGDAKKNMYWFSIILIFVNLVFLALGALLFIYSQEFSIELPIRSDEIFPFIATKLNLSPILSIFFTIGLVAAAYSSADSALTALTTSFTVDILGTQKASEEKLKKTRIKVHVFFSIVLAIVILILNLINNRSVIDIIFIVAGYTYGPLLGIYAFGLLTKFQVKDKFVPLISILSPAICFVLSENSEYIFFGYKFGFELLILNGFFTFVGLLIIKKK
ncbi:MAG: sodium:solute symporter [Bacteroidetes bacterium]|jgi:solute:Na+ symporter, SSS family|nr:sodium:solute symporter [Bacteroidota bacterium]MBT6687383.1 sodium:solute symporter [Bacteroidota bacterium]MBT7143934.1 sodium:solute symporter [Bacteroidota bacterium]MBT7492438.1 sodium:solute symporter [Bacteroidota bacterium]